MELLGRGIRNQLFCGDNHRSCEVYEIPADTNVSSHLVVQNYASYIVYYLIVS